MIILPYTATNPFLTFLQSPARRLSFKNALPDISLPPEPIITRWGTWLNACVYYADNFDSVKSFVRTLDDDDAESIRQSKELFSSPGIRHDLAFIKNNFSDIVKGIKVLESKGLELNESIGVVEKVRLKLGSIQRKEFLQKFERVLSRNTDIDSLMQIRDILYGNTPTVDNPTEYVAGLSPLEIDSFKFCPVSSVDVERTFSIYKNVLTDRRHSFTFENLKHHLIFACNNEFS